MATKKKAKAAAEAIGDNRVEWRDDRVHIVDLLDESRNLLAVLEAASGDAEETGACIANGRAMIISEIEERLSACIRCLELENGAAAAPAVQQ